MGRGLAVGDLDNDGRLDVLILSHNQPLAYLHNRTKGGRFLSLRLEGRPPNRDAVGAKVVVIAGGRRRVRRASRQAAATNRRPTRGSTSAWAPIDRIEVIEIRWPSGNVDRYSGLPANAGYLLHEGDDKPRPLPGFPNIVRSEIEKAKIANVSCAWTPERSGIARERPEHSARPPC